ncbi:MAG TPA: hypothetical protein VM735_00730, partial [Candidatus Kapabacteria bacterium]|nr:hypothetical protein [Candidatus Kapabacteria bacterium]
MKLNLPVTIRGIPLNTLRFTAFAILLLCATIGPKAAQNTPDLIHSPAQPRSGESVTVTANVPFTNPTLQLQVVPPGSYIRRTDPSFNSSWQDFPMEKRGPSFVAKVPPDLQKHRNLVRYRIKGSNSGKPSDYYPNGTNEVPNFAWFVYDGFPTWKGSSRPRGTPELTFSPEFLGTLPTYHLIAKGDDVKNSQWNPGSNRQPFTGTL